MSNTFGVFMSYCRFEGANRAIQEALGDAQNSIDSYYCNNIYEAKSDREVEKLECMIGYFVDWLHENDLLDDEGYIDDDNLYKVTSILKGEEPQE